MAFEVSVAWRNVDGLKKEDLNRSMRHGLSTVGTRWCTKFQPKHYTRAGAAEYGYLPLNPRYQARKVKLARMGVIPGGALPFVYSGEMRQQALYGPPNFKATANSRGASLRIRLPRKANYLGASRLEELRRVSPREKAELEQLLVGTLEFNLRRLGRTSASARARIGAAPAAAAA